MPARENMTPEERARADAIDLRCLSLCIGMLERVNGVRRRLNVREQVHQGFFGRRLKKTQL